MCYSDTLMGSQCGLPVTMNLVGLMLIKIFLLLPFRSSANLPAEQGESATMVLDAAED